jgi:hypothetical protein
VGGHLVTCRSKLEQQLGRLEATEPDGRAPGISHFARTLPESRVRERNLRSLCDFGCTLDDGGERPGKIGKGTREDSGESPQIPDYRAK